MEFIPSSTVPTLTSTDAATIYARDLIDALQHPAPPSPFHTLGDKQFSALKQLADIFSISSPSPNVHSSIVPRVKYSVPRMTTHVPRVP